MAVKINGSSVEWHCYEYAIVDADGDVIRHGRLDELRANVHTNERVMFRAVYITDWMETL